MALLSTGLIIAGAYADKVRKSLFARLREELRVGKLSPQEVARAIAELNMVLYHVFAEELKLSKGDVVRVRVEYKVGEGKISWNYDSLQLEIFKKVKAEAISGAVERAVSKVGRLPERASSYRAEPVVTTSYGDRVYRLELGGRAVGALIVTAVDDESIIVRGALLKPSAAVIDRVKVTLEGKSIDEALSGRLTSIIETARSTETPEAEKVIKSIEAIVGSEAGKSVLTA